tara:strand:+ start:381 stop:1094 length:714 start_codon:yes stop_codon:yes gene_type:complete
MVRLLTERENVEACRLYKPIPIFLQKAVLNPPDSIRKNPYKDNHRDVEPNYQAPVNPLAMALNAEGMYGMNAKSYLGVYNKLINVEIEKNRNELDRDLEEVDEDTPGYYYNKHPLNLAPDEMVKQKKGNLRRRNYHKNIEEREEHIEQQIVTEMYSKGIAVDPVMNSLSLIPAGPNRGATMVSTGSQTQEFRRPPGRPPTGGQWDSVRGYYVYPETQLTESIQPGVFKSAPEDRVAQ